MSVALIALTSSLLLMTSCDDPHKHEDSPAPTNQNVTMPVNPGPDFTTPITTIQDNVIPAVADSGWGTIELLARTDPADPHNERFLDGWRFQVTPIDDLARPLGSSWYGSSGPNGHALVGLPIELFSLPLVVTAYNEIFPLDCELPINPGAKIDDPDICSCNAQEIFIPALCHDKAPWLVGPFEAALWDYYREAAQRRGEAWNPSQVDCGTWLAHMQFLLLTDQIIDELNEISDRDDMFFRSEALIAALQENQHLLVPTRPPICMAERRHNGGGMERAETATLPLTLDDSVLPFETEVLSDFDPIVIGNNGIVDSICGVNLTGSLVVNGNTFQPTNSYYLDDQDFIGSIHDQANIVNNNMDVAYYNTRLGNGRELDHDKYDDACALTSIIEFTNKDDDEQDVTIGTGVTFTDLFEGGLNTTVYLTSDGDNVVDDNDTWAIFYRSSDAVMTERVILVELLGHRQEDFRDVLHMAYDSSTEDLFVGVRADYELNEEEVDGERAYLLYTVTVLDGSTLEGRIANRENIANCYEASDVWARQFFNTDLFQEFEGCCFDEECEVESLIQPLWAAEFIARSQCFSNSRSNQRWRTDDSGYWSMNNEHGVHGNVIVNPGWLAPDLDFEIYIQKFDEAVFKGPRTIRRTDEIGQLMAEIPTLVEGDRVLIKAEDNCCDDYDLVIPCVPEFTGFAGLPGVPFVPVTAVPPVGPVAVPVP